MSKIVNKSIGSIGDYINLLSRIPNRHSREDGLYKVLSKEAKKEALSIFGENEICEDHIGHIGKLKLPFFCMGNISSVDLFGLDELIILSFYAINKGRYKKAMDIGANIGLHSIFLSKLGAKVISFEPDPEHIAQLSYNIKINNAKNIELVEKAVSDEYGSAEFSRVEGNTTGSHLSGAKEKPYGSIKKFTVEVTKVNDLLKDHDLVKIDAEGQEARILLSTQSSDWLSCDAIIEVGTQENASLIYSHFYGSEVNLFSQKRNWNKVSCREDMPTSYKEGSLFLSAKDQMPWKVV